MFVPVSKRSKKEQKLYYSKQRKNWGNISPVTKAVPNKKKVCAKVEEYDFEGWI